MAKKQKVCKVCRDQSADYAQTNANFDGWCRSCYRRYRFLVRALGNLGARDGSAKQVLNDLLSIDGECGVTDAERLAGKYRKPN